MSDIVVVGAGLFGLTVAERLASSGRKVTIIDRRDHIGGNAYSYRDEHGIEIHKYGAHLFHTSNEAVWEYVTQFTSFTDYRHRVYTTYNGEVFPMPINLGTINQFFHASYGPQDAKQLVDSQRAGLDPDKADNLEDKAISLIGRDLYEAFIKDYTAKQWQTDPRNLPASIISRLPVRYNYNNRYFSDTYEGLPADGYTRWFERMLDNPNIEVQTGIDFFNVSHMIVDQVPVVYTGPLDRYFNNVEGALSWRTVDLDLVTLDEQDYLGTSVMNYADNSVDFTRIIEFKHFHPERAEIFNSNKTTLAYEYSRFARDNDEPYYPINSVHDKKKLEVYRQLAREETDTHKVYFGGRLGNYAYLDMHQAISSALHLVDKKLLDL